MGQDLQVVITDDMVKRYKALGCFVNRTFFLRSMEAKYPGTCIISGQKFEVGTRIGYQKVQDGNKSFALVAIINEINLQMKQNLKGQGTRELKSDATHYRIPADKISVQQQAATDVFLDTDFNLSIESRAGGGKTAMLRHLASFRRDDQKFVYTAFNRKNAAEGKKKLPLGVPSMTSHTFMLGVIKKQFRLPKEPTPQKTWIILGEVYPACDAPRRKAIRRAVVKLVGLAKNTALMPDDITGIRNLLSRFDFDLEQSEDYDTLVEVTSDVLKASLPTSSFGTMYDFDDMLWWAVVLNLALPKYDCIFADECQDFNPCQIWMMKKLGENGTRLVIVGDPYQAVYRFRGADSEAFKKLCEVLEEGRGAKKILFPTNYRCGKAIIEYVKAYSIVKDIEYAPNAVDGMVRGDMTYNELLNMLASEATPVT